MIVVIHAFSLYAIVVVLFPSPSSFIPPPTGQRGTGPQAVEAMSEGHPVGLSVGLSVCRSMVVANGGLHCTLKYIVALTAAAAASASYAIHPSTHPTDRPTDRPSIHPSIHPSILT